MFGFLNPATHDLAFRSLYARCCQHLRRRYGLFTLPFHNYEPVFLYACALDAGLFEGFRPLQQSCCWLQSAGGLCSERDAAMGEFTAALTVLLAHIETEDHLRDEDDPLSWSWHRARRALLGSAPRESERYFRRLDPLFPQRLSRILGTQLAVEGQTRVSLRQYVRPTANAFRYVFGLVGRLPGAAELGKLLEGIGAQIGVAVVAADCAADWREDVDRGRPNPVRGEAEAELAAELCQESLAAAETTLAAAFGREASSVHIVQAVRSRVAASGGLCPSCGLPIASSKPQGVALNACCGIPGLYYHIHESREAAEQREKEASDQCTKNFFCCCCGCTCCFFGLCGSRH